MRWLLLCLFSIFALPLHAADADKIVGTWKLVSVMYEDAQTKERTPVLGEHPRGYQIATPEGRWLALVTADGRPVPKTDEDRAKALRTMIAYSGRYRVEGDKVITKVEVAWNEAWVGGEQVRYLRAITYFSSEGFVGFSKRLPTNRRQPYLRNRGLDQVKPGSVIKAYDCDNVNNPDTAPEPSSAPACVQEAPWPKVFGGGMFPRLTREAP